VGSLARWIQRRWVAPTLVSRATLAPAAAAFGLASAARRRLYRAGWRRQRRLPVPVVVVGNITVGGSGKTPLVIHLVRQLRAAGWTPGVVSRGHGGSQSGAQRLGTHADPGVVGDEPALIAWAADCPVAVGVDRAAAAELLLRACDVVIADDGLQHYALARDIEIAVIGGDVGLGNSRGLPAGPLREPASRLAQVDFVAVRDGVREGAYRIDVTPGDPVPLCGRHRAGPPLAQWAGQRVHAVAGIGVPERFFSQLEAAGLVIQRHAFADHDRLVAADLVFDNNRPVLMTQKDAVKCRPFADARLWYLPAELADPDGLADAVRQRLARLSEVINTR